MIAAVVLAAGESSRMGRPKQLLRYRGRSLVRRACEAALDAGCRPVVAVLGAHAAEVGKGLAALDVRTVTNEAWEEGMASSIRAGIQVLEQDPDRPEAVILLACDQPRVAAGVIGRLIEAHRKLQKPMVACEYSGTVGVPALFARGMFPELMRLKGEGGAKQILLQNGEQVARVAWPEGAVDVDTPTDLDTIDDASTEG